MNNRRLCLHTFRLKFCICWDRDRVLVEFWFFSVMESLLKTFVKHLFGECWMITEIIFQRFADRKSR